MLLLLPPLPCFCCYWIPAVASFALDSSTFWDVGSTGSTFISSSVNCPHSNSPIQGKGHSPLATRHSNSRRQSSGKDQRQWRILLLSNDPSNKPTTLYNHYQGTGPCPVFKKLGCYRPFKPIMPSKRAIQPSRTNKRKAPISISRAITLPVWLKGVTIAIVKPEMPLTHVGINNLG